MIKTDWIQRVGYYDEQPVEKRRILLYGSTGVGKTRFAASAPSPFFIDTDKGGRTLQRLHVPFVPINDSDRASYVIRDMLEALRTDKEPFDKLKVETIVFDSLTTLAEMLLYESMRYPSGGNPRRDPLMEKPVWDDYNAVKTRINDLIRRCKDMDKNVIAIAGDQIERDEQRGTYVGKPALVGSYRNLIGYDFDEVYYMAKEGKGGKTSYKLFTSKYLYFDGKSREAESNKDIKEEYTDPTYEKIFGPESTG